MRMKYVLLLIFVFVLLLGCIHAQSIEIEFTTIPPDGEGPTSQGTIAGKIDGLDDPQKYNVVIYAHTNRWYIQPLENSYRTEIYKDGTWDNWTHLGNRYGVLVIRKDAQYTMKATVNSLSEIKDGVVARREVAASK